MHTRTIVLALSLIAVAGCNPMGDFDLWYVGPLRPGDVAQVAGIWRGTDTLTSVSNGECPGPELRLFVASESEVELSVRQDGLTLTGTSTQQPGTTVCPFAGSFSSPTSLTLTSVNRACDVRSFTGVICPNGEPRQLKHLQDVMDTVVEGRVMTAQRVVSYHVYVPGDLNPSASMTFRSTMRLERQ